MEPDVLSVPDQAPLAVQAFALELVQERVALWPGMMALGLRETLTVALGDGGVEVIADPLPLQPERTKAKRRKMTHIEKRGFLDSVGTCIRPSFYELYASSCWIKRIQYRVRGKEYIYM